MHLTSSVKLIATFGISGKFECALSTNIILTHMTDKCIGKPVLKHCYCEHEYKKSEIKRVPKVKKNVFNEPRMANICSWYAKHHRGLASVIKPTDFDLR